MFPVIFRTIYFRLFMVVAVLVFLMFTLFLIVTTASHRKLENSQLNDDANHLLSSINALVDHAMLHNPKEVNHYIPLYLEKIANLKAVTHISILRPDSTVIFSNDSKLTGKHFSHNRDLSCLNCKRRFYNQTTGSDIFDEGNLFHLVREIPLKESCKPCHTKDPIGKIVMILKNENIDKMQQEESKIILFFFFLFLIIFLGILFFLLRKMIRNPLLELNKAFSDLKSGNFKGEKMKTSTQEIQQLFNNFSEMQLILKNNFHEMEEEIKARTLKVETSYEEIQQLQSRIIEIEKLATLSEIAASMAHEIRTPINSLSINTQTIMRLFNKAGIGIDFEETNQLILADIKRINGVIEIFLSQIQKKDLPKIKLKFSSIIEDINLLFKAEIKKQEIIFNYLCEDGLEIYGNRDQLNQVFVNFFINSLAAMSEKKEKVISLTAKDTTDKILVTFSDNGAGIPEENLKEIFKPFYSTKNNGTGLGLSIIRRIVNNHQGKISVESKVDKGTIFYMEFEKNGK